MLPRLRLLAEEDPQLHLEWNEALGTIHLRLMGEVQAEILKRVIADRFGLAVEFGPGDVVYAETIAEAVEGVGHFEPLRHYAEVHLLLEPLPLSSLRIKKQREVKNFCRHYPAGPRRIGLAQSSGKSTLPTKE